MLDCTLVQMVRLYRAEFRLLECTLVQMVRLYRAELRCAGLYVSADGKVVSGRVKVCWTVR